MTNDFHFVKRRTALALVTLAAFAVAAGMSTDAEACSPKPSGSHYYAIIEKTYASQADRGAAVSLDTTSLSVSNNNDFVDHEMWYGVVGSGAYWVEAGFTDGLTYSGSAVNDHFFWADNRNGGGYHEHYPSFGWSMNHWYQVRITWAGYSCGWNVDVAGQWKGTSTGNCAGSLRYMAAGIEATTADSNSHDGGYLGSWQQLDSSNTWHSGWSGAQGIAYCPADINVYSGSTEEVLHGPI